MEIPRVIYLVVQYLSEHAHVLYRNVLIILKQIRLNDAYTRVADDFPASHSSIEKIFSLNMSRVTKCAPTTDILACVDN